MTLLTAAPYVLGDSATSASRSVPVPGVVRSAASIFPADILRSANGDGPATRGTVVQIGPVPAPPPALKPGDSLEIPPDSGTGRRVVYSKGIQRVWMIEEDGTLYNTHRVSGRPNQPTLGTTKVFSRSPTTCSRLHTNICMRFMVRFARNLRDDDNIGFHEIPRRDGIPMQSEDELGLALSGGCVRQSTADAILMWDWAQLGTVVVVVS